MEFIEIEGARSRPSISTQFQRLGEAVRVGNPDIRWVNKRGNWAIQFERDRGERRSEVNARSVWNQGESLTFSGRVKFDNAPATGYVTQFKESYNGTSEGNLAGSVRVQNGRLSILGLRGSVAIQSDQWINYRVVATRDRNNRGSLIGWLNGQQVGVARNVQFGRRDQAHNLKFGLYGAANRSNEREVVWHDDVRASVDSLTGSRNNQPLVGRSEAVRSSPNRITRYQLRRWSPITISNFDHNDELLVDARAFNIARGDIGDRFTYGSSARDRGDRFIFNVRSGELYFDRDGTGRRYGQQLVARVGNGVIDGNDIRVA